MNTLPDDLETFSDRVYWLVEQVPEGAVATYGQIATYAGSAGAARAVGNLMRNSLQNGVEVPWQRIINAAGRISFKGDVARATLQRELLEREGIAFSRAGVIAMAEHRWEPDHDYWMVEP